MATELSYPRLQDLEHGDILLPRQLLTPAVTTFTDTLSERARAIAEALKSGKPQPPWDKPAALEGFNLLDYWPYLMAHLRAVRESKLDLGELLKTVFDELPSGSLSKGDLSQAIIARQYVGHCAIFDREALGDEAWVIESSHTHGGMHAMPYERWRVEREESGAAVWVYRLGPATHEQRLRFVNMAHQLRMQGVRYAIFDGRDGSKMCLEPADQRALGASPYLYCSELVYYCALEVLGLDLLQRTLDAPPLRHDGFAMFTPKDIVGSAHVERVVNAPGGKPYSLPSESI